MEGQRHESHWIALLPLVAFAVAFWILGIQISYASRRSYSTPPSFVRIPIAIWLSIAVHECGHVLAALLVRFQILSFNVWPLSIEKISGSRRLRFYSSAAVPGSVIAYPRGPYEVPKRLALMVAGGPAASLFVGLLAAWAALAGLKPFFGIDPWMLAGFSTLIAITALIPQAAQGIRTDGWYLNVLRRGGLLSDQLCSLFMLTYYGHSGQRPRDYDPKLLAPFEHPSSESPFALSGQGLRYNWLLECKRFDEAEQALQWILAHVEGARARIWQLEAVWFFSRFRSDLESAKKWIGAARSADNAKDLAYLKARAALLFLEGKPALAEKQTEEALLLCSAEVDKGLSIGLRDEVNDLLSDIRQSRISGGASPLTLRATSANPGEEGG